ncbi:Lipid A core - O-antigen ligase [Vibrio ichthyoenteri ATCC 700023]|uniref:Lipid A core-O-antigen ligase n=1 Tax=Vibrio ichthyoenteri ATCC 700023 TaxID=870968 RepID=F9RZQ0_9VIBR|nr:O-antigen ligase family protein [Vibrio ichthyoenteri]EGU44458.1 Lipid A core - O-antigen ligase [Vibrio ichthyoenteri ATCC 700023]
MSRAISLPHLTGLLLVCFILSLAWLTNPHPAIIIALGLLPLGALFVINQIFWMVSLFVLFSFFRIHEAFPVIYNLRIPLLLSLGALSALCFHILISKQIKPFWHPCLGWLIAFWLLIFIGILFASNLGVAFEYFKNVYWKIIIMTLAIAWLIESELSLKRMAIMIVLAGLLIASVAISNALGGIGLVEGSRVTIGRDLGSMLGDPNDLSLVLMFPLAFSLSLMMTKQLGWVRILGGVCTVAAFYAVIETQSRGGLLGSLAILGIFGLKYIRSKFLLALLGTIAVAVLFTMAGISDRQSGGSSEAGIDESAMGRLYAWEAAFKMALDRPLTGVGIDNFYFNYYFYSSHWDGLNHAVHSTWFGVMAEAGFVGLFVFIGIIVTVIKTSRKNLQALKESAHHFSPYVHATAFAVYASLIGTIVSGTFLTQGFNWPIYILSGLAIACHRIIHNDSQNENDNTTRKHVNINN